MGIPFTHVGTPYSVEGWKSVVFPVVSGLSISSVLRLITEILEKGPLAPAKRGHGPHSPSDNYVFYQQLKHVRAPSGVGIGA
jgi:hypothetical protein